MRASHKSACDAFKWRCGANVTSSPFHCGFLAPDFADERTRRTRRAADGRVDGRPTGPPDAAAPASRSVLTPRGATVIAPSPSGEPARGPTTAFCSGHRRPAAQREPPRTPPRLARRHTARVGRAGRTEQPKGVRSTACRQATTVYSGHAVSIPPYIPNHVRPQSHCAGAWSKQTNGKGKGGRGSHTGAGVGFGGDRRTRRTTSRRHAPSVRSTRTASGRRTMWRPPSFSQRSSARPTMCESCGPWYEDIRYLEQASHDAKG